MARKRKLDRLMSEIANCRLCCEPIGSNILPEKRLRNLIQERPAEYGNIPHLFTDWANRLNSKIFVVGQDWGPDEEVLYIRNHYEHSRSDWKFIVRNRPDGASKSDMNISHFFRESAIKEGLDLPIDFMDRIYFTNAVLCFQRAQKGDSGTKHIDLRKSIDNCCNSRRFLHKQIEIVNPDVIVTLGKWPLGGLKPELLGKSLGKLVDSIRTGSGNGFIRPQINDKSLFVFPVFHPAARPVNRNHDAQVNDYRYIWKRIKDTIYPDKTAEEIIDYLFPNS